MRSVCNLRPDLCCEDFHRFCPPSLENNTRPLLTTSSFPKTSVAAATVGTTGCPKNCGTPDRGGGTCAIRPSDTALICKSCNSNRIRQRGICLLEVHCRARSVQSGALKGSGCRCANPRCHNCKRRSVSEGGDVCTVCRDGWYLLGGDCVETCPAHMTMSGISLFRRRCIDPHVCRGGKIYDAPLGGTFTQPLFERGAPYGCRCPAPGNVPGGYCFACEHRAGEHGDRCLRCSAGRYLFEGACLSRCPNGTQGVGSSSYGRECG